MAEFKALPLDKILVPERLRAVEEDHAFMIAQSIKSVGLLNPVTVRATPRAARPYTLVAGAHRLRGCELAGLREIDAAVVKAGALDGQLVEIEENIFRNELSALDRAIFVQKYRELWEEKHGKVGAGGDRRSEEYQSVKLTEWSDESQEGQYFRRVSERLGLSRSAVERAQFIGQKLSPELRSALRGTPVADNQSQLIKLARMLPERQGLVASAFARTPDIALAMELSDPNARAKEKQPAHEEQLGRLVAAWNRADEKARGAFLEHIGAAPKSKRDRLPSVSEVLSTGGVA